MQPFSADAEPIVHSAYRRNAEGSEYTLNLEIDGKHFNVDVAKALPKKTFACFFLCCY